MAQVDRLQSFESEHYLIHTNLEKKAVVDIGRHMDRVFAEYERRFSEFRSRRVGAMPLYLFRTQEDYLRFMASRGISAQNSGGMFFVTPSAHGLSTWTAGRSRSETFEVLQHEGFHQFAFNYVGTQLPVWANEGLAQYFEDAIIASGGMKLGLANARRLALVQRAIEAEQAIPLDELLGVTNAEWGQTLSVNPPRAALLYAQSWSFVYFLVHGDGGRYKAAFASYLVELNKGTHSPRAFRKAFGVENLSPLQTRWAKYVRDQTPDPINAAKEKLEFFGAALGYLHEQGEPMPATMDELRGGLQERRFRLTRQSHGLSTEYDASDDGMFEFTRPNGSIGAFDLLAPVRDDLPPRITAPGLRPTPTLVWSRNEEGALVQDIDYK